jgi:hypothetical protein
MPTEDLAFGRNKTLGFCIEGTAGVYAPADYNQAFGTPTLKGIGFLEATPGPNTEMLIEPHMSGRPEMTDQDIVAGVNNSTFTVKMKCPKENLVWFILGFFGKITTSGVSSPYLHNFVPSLANGYPASFKLEYREPLNATETRLQLRGCKVKSMTFEFKANETAIVTIEFIGASWGKSGSLGTAPAILIPASTNPFWTFADIITADTKLTYSATSIVGFSSIVIKLENSFAEGVEDSYEGGSNERIRLERAADKECIRLTATLKRLLKDSYPFNWWSALNTCQFQISLSSISLYSLFFSSYGRLLSLPVRSPRGLGLIEETIEFQSFYSIADSASIVGTVQDTQSGTVIPNQGN